MAWADHSARQVHPRFILASLHLGFEMRCWLTSRCCRSRSSRELLGPRGLAWRVVCVAIASSVAAQGQPRPVVAGVVQDQTGAVLADATVELVSVAGATSSVVQSTTADGTGTFRFESVAPGQYELRATYEGFKPASTRLRVGPAAAGRPEARARNRRPQAGNHGQQRGRPRSEATASNNVDAVADRPEHARKPAGVRSATTSRRSRASSTPDRSATAASPSSSTAWK